MNYAVSLRRLWFDPGPDHGWSWVIVVSSLFYSFLLQGIFKAQGYLFAATVDSYGVSREEASWPYVLFFATAHVSGVFAGLLNHYLNCRTIMFICSALMCLGYAVCFLAPPSIIWMTVGYGVIAGPNLGITFASLLQIVNEYFEKYRTTANQFLMAGLGFGGLIYPFFLYHLLSTYGLRGTFLMLCAFNLHTFIAAALLRPRTPKYFPILTSSIPSGIVLDTQSKNETRVCETSAPLQEKNGEMKGNLHSLQNEALSCDAIPCNEVAAFPPLEARNPTEKSVETPIHQRNSGLFEHDEMNHGEKNLHPVQCEDLSSELEELVDSIITRKDAIALPQPEAIESVDQAVELPIHHSDGGLSKQGENEKPEGSVEKSAFFKAPDQEVKLPIHQLNSDPAEQDITERQDSTIEKTTIFEAPEQELGLPIHQQDDGSNDQYKTEKQGKVDEKPADAALPHQQEILQKINSADATETPPEKKSYTDLLRALFRDPMFYIITLSSLFDIVAWGVFFMTVVDYATDCGMWPGLATMLLPAHSAAEILVRLGTGWITDNGYVGIKVFHLASVVLTGVFFALFPLARGDGLFFAFACVLGCLYGTSTGSRLVLYVEYLDVEKMPTANGTLLFLAGIVFLGIPKLLGVLRDSFGSYDLIYICQGALCLTSALAWMLEPGLISSLWKNKFQIEKRTASEEQKPCEVVTADTLRDS